MATPSAATLFQNLTNSRLDWRLNYARATRDEPDLRETLYERPINSAANVTYTYADESQSGFRMFNELNDDTLDASGNWSGTSAVGGRPASKFGVSYVVPARLPVAPFHFIPITTQKADTGNLLFDNLLPPEEIFTPTNIGTAFRLNEASRPCMRGRSDDGRRATGWWIFRSATARGSSPRPRRTLRSDRHHPGSVRMCTRGAGVEQKHRFLPGRQLRAGGGGQLERPSELQHDGEPAEFRELAEFEFTDVVGNRAVKVWACGGPHPERGRPVGRFTGGRGIVAASVFFEMLRQADRAGRHCVCEPDCHVPELGPCQELRH